MMLKNEYHLAEHIHSLPFFANLILSATLPYLKQRGVIAGDQMSDDLQRSAVKVIIHALKASGNDRYGKCPFPKQNGEWV